jgi:hypothetical protein
MQTPWLKQSVVYDVETTTHTRRQSIVTHSPVVYDAETTTSHKKKNSCYTDHNSLHLEPELTIVVA